MGAGPLTLHSMNCSMGKGEENRDSELQWDLWSKTHSSGEDGDSCFGTRV